MKYQLILSLLACVIWASEIVEKRDLQDDLQHGVSNPTHAGTNLKGSNCTRNRKNTKALEQVRRRQTKLKREELKKALEKKAEEEAREKREENEAEAKEILRNIVKYDEMGETFSVYHYAEPPKRDNFFRFLYNMCRKKEKTSVHIENVEFAKFAVSDNLDLLVVVILSREKEDLPGKFDEFIVDLGKNVIRHNDIINTFGQETFKKEAEQNRNQFMKGAHAFAEVNPNWGKESQTKMWMMNQEKTTKKLFKESANAKELDENFRFQGSGGLYGSNYGAFRSREEYSLSQK